MSTKKEAYLCLSAMLRAREPKLLNNDRAERMLDAASDVDEEIADLVLMEEEVPADMIRAALRNRHKAAATPGSVVARVFGLDFAVNSFHHQAVGAVAPGFAVTAASPDGVVEAIEAQSGAFCVGVQWHPERLIHSLPANLELFRTFTAAAAEYQAG